MSFRPILRLLLAGLLASSALLAPWPGEGPDTPHLSVGYQVAHADTGDWPMFRHDPAHTGYNPDETQLKPPLRLKWSYTTGGEIYSSPAVANGVVYVGSSDKKVYALEAASGALRWSYTTGGEVRSSPAVASGVVYVGSRDGKVYALEAASSAPRWSYNTGYTWVDPSPAVVGGVVYVRANDGPLYALDDASGGLRWSYGGGGGGREIEISSAAVADGVVCVGLYTRSDALEAVTGALRWSYIGGYVKRSPVVANGVCYVVDLVGRVYALDAATGALRWGDTTAAQPYSHSSPAVANGAFYVGYSNANVYARDAATGTPQWSYTRGGGGDSSPAVANGVVYVGSSDAKVYALDAATGALLWSYTTGGQVHSSPAVANGVLYVGSQDGKLYAFEAQPPPVPISVAAYQTAGASFPISWTVPTNWTGVAAASYDVQYRDGASGAWTDLLSSTVVSSTTFSGQDGHTYYFRARSRTTTGSLGDWSEVVSTTVDLTAPTGSLQAQGWSSPYISNTVTLSVAASDATSGLSQMQFGSDGLTFGYWETYTTTRSYVAPPGATAVYGRFKDGAGNISQPVTGSVTLDASPPAGSLQTQGWSSPYISNTVTLSVAASDSTSGLSQMQFGSDGQSFNPWETYGTSSLYLAPPGATTVYGRFKDNAGNVSQPVSATIALDNVSPTGSVSINGGAAYATSMTATLALSATDGLSGVSEMALSNDGTAWNGWEGYSTSKSWPLASGPDGPRTAHARFRDAAGNVSPVYSDTIILDTAAPTGTVTINGGASDTNSTAVALTLAAGDAMSGLAQMSFSNDGQSYSPWEAYAASRSWSVPGGNGTKTVYARFRDNAGNVSQAYTDTIVLNTILPSSAVSPLALYQSTAAFTVTWQGTVGGSGPPTYDVQYRDGAAGTWTDWITSTLSTSAVFTGTEGHTYYFQSRARDLAGNTEPYPGEEGDTRTTVDLTPPSGALTINGGALDSTAVTVTLGLSASDSLSGVAQASYSDDGSSWGGWESYAATRSWTLPSGDGEKAVWARFRDVAGNISTPVSDTIRLDTSVAPAYGFSVNEGALFTSQVTVTLSLPANPGTAQMMLSNDGGFHGAAWEPYSAYRAWAITQYGSYVIPRTVYVKYKDVTGNVSGVYQDDIILDVNAPSGSVSIEGAGAAGVQGQGARVQGLMPHASAWGGDATPLPHSPLSVNGEGVGGEVASAAAAPVTLKLSASDDVSGVGGMMVSNSPAFAGASWEPFSASKSWSLESGSKVYVAFKDNAGNASPIYAAALSGGKESLPSVVLGTVHPKTGGTVTSSETGTSVAFPTGAVTSKAEVTLVPAAEPSQQASTGALKSTGKFLTLTARAGETPVTTVSQPYTITVSYAAGDVAGIDESTLAVYWWNGSAWQKEPGSRVDTAARRVSAALDHLSAFAVLGESSTRKLYLPLVIRSYAGGW